ncbi:hypothetical protein Sjap_013112 [Stephania japonica]|uniref:Uncharacterized protein n=1 Tax=Stephania japonica TaxID=461633 RepID=A0AAP0IYI2_9MAGN
MGVKGNLWLAMATSQGKALHRRVLFKWYWFLHRLSLVVEHARPPPRLEIRSSRSP